MAEIIPTDDFAAARQRAVEALHAGALVVAPTDTCYAVLADAFAGDATGKLFAARGADRSRPLPVLVRNAGQLRALVTEVSDQAERLIGAFWPGSLTLLLPVVHGLTWDLGDLEDAVAVRQPDEPLLLELVAEIGPLACTAATTAGGAPPRTVEEARAALGDAVEVYVDGGGRPGLRSTVVDCSRGGAEVLRPGSVSADEVLAAVHGDPAAEAAPGEDDEER